MGLLVNLGSRLAPWLGRLFKMDKTLLARLLVRLRQGGNFVGHTAGDIAKWAMSHKMNAAFLLYELGGLGIKIDNALFGNDAIDKDAETKDAVARAEAARVAALEKQGPVAVIENTNNVTSMPQFGMKSEDLDSIETLKSVLRWARHHYGGTEAAIEGHILGMVFHKMPHDAIVNGFKHLKLI